MARFIKAVFHYKFANLLMCILLFGGTAFLESSRQFLPFAEIGIIEKICRVLGFTGLFAWTTLMGVGFFLSVFKDRSNYTLFTFGWFMGKVTGMWVHALDFTQKILNKFFGMNVPSIDDMDNSNATEEIVATFRIEESDMGGQDNIKQVIADLAPQGVYVGNNHGFSADVGYLGIHCNVGASCENIEELFSELQKRYGEKFEILERNQAAA